MLFRGLSSAPLLPSLSVTSKYSISDSDLESQGFLLRRTFSDLNLDHLNSVFVSVGFPRQDPEKIKIALENTGSLLWVQDKRTQKPSLSLEQPGMTFSTPSFGMWWSTLLIKRSGWGKQ